MDFQNNDFPIRSLLRDYNGKRWYPKSVEIFRSMLLIPPTSEFNGYAISKNIAYNLQYLEYLQKQINELVLSDVLMKMLIKNFIIVSMGIIESLFAYLLKSTGNWNQSEWKMIQKNNIDNSRPISVSDKILKTKMDVYEKVDKYDTEMQFDAIISKVKSKKLLDVKDDKIYDIILRYKKLRNKVHLHISQYETDYNIFDIRQQKVVSKLLYLILTDKQFCSNQKIAHEVYGFLIDEA